MMIKASAFFPTLCLLLKYSLDSLVLEVAGGFPSLGGASTFLFQSNAPVGVVPSSGLSFCSGEGCPVYTSMERLETGCSVRMIRGIRCHHC